MPPRLSQSTPEAILFDVDGTLVDTMRAVVCGLGDTCERHFGFRPSNEAIRSLIGRPIRQQFETFAPAPPTETQLEEMTAEAIERFEARQDLERLYEPAVQALVSVHRAGIRTALVTSKNAHELELFLKRFPGAEHVDATVCASDVRHPKPAPDSALLACRRLGVEPRSAVMVGDSVYDVQCGHAAGMPVVAVSYGAAPHDVLAAEHPDLLLETPEALLDWVQTSILPTPCPERS